MSVYGDQEGDETWLRGMIHRGQERCAGRGEDVSVDARDRTRGHNARGVVCERVHMDNNQDREPGRARLAYVEVEGHP